MSMYQAAVSSGLQSLMLEVTGESAATKAAYNTAYAEATHRRNTANAKHAAEVNIGRIEQDKVLSNTKIKMQQDQEAARAMVSAAAAGVEGGSVRDVIYGTERNEAWNTANANAKGEQEKEGYLAQIGTQQSALLAAPDTKVDTTGNILSTLADNFELSDAKQMFGMDSPKAVDDQVSK